MTSSPNEQQQALQKQQQQALQRQGRYETREREKEAKCQDREAKRQRVETSAKRNSPTNESALTAQTRKDWNLRNQAGSKRKENQGKNAANKEGETTVDGSNDNQIDSDNNSETREDAQQDDPWNKDHAHAVPESITVKIRPTSTPPRPRRIILDEEGNEDRPWKAADYAFPDGLETCCMYRDECPGAHPKIAPPLGGDDRKPAHFVPWNRFTPFLKVGRFQYHELLPSTIERIQTLADPQCALLHMKLLSHWINHRFDGLNDTWLDLVNCSSGINSPQNGGTVGSFFSDKKGGTNRLSYVVVMTAACFAFGPDVLPTKRNGMNGSMMEMLSVKYKKECGYRVTPQAMMDFQRFITIFFDCECPSQRKYNLIGYETETAKWKRIFGQEDEPRAVKAIGDLLDKFQPRIIDRDIFDLDTMSYKGCNRDLRDHNRPQERLVDKDFFTERFQATFFANQNKKRGWKLIVYSVNSPGMNDNDSKAEVFYPDLLVLRSVSVVWNNMVFDLQNSFWKWNYPKKRNVPTDNSEPLCMFQKAIATALPGSPDGGIFAAELPSVENEEHAIKQFQRLQASAIRREQGKQRLHNDKFEELKVAATAREEGTKQLRDEVITKNKETRESAYRMALKAWNDKTDPDFQSLSGNDSLQPEDGWGGDPNLLILPAEEEVLFFPFVRKSDICAQPDASFQNWINCSPLWRNDDAERKRQIWLINQTRKTEEELWLASEYRFYDHNPKCSFWDDEIGAQPKDDAGNYAQNEGTAGVQHKDTGNDGTTGVQPNKNVDVSQEKQEEDSDEDSDYGVDSNGKDLSSCRLCLGKEYRPGLLQEPPDDYSFASSISMDNLLAEKASRKDTRTANRSGLIVTAAANQWREVLPPQEYPVDSDYESIISCCDWVTSKREEPWMNVETYFTANDYVVPPQSLQLQPDDQVPCRPFRLTEVASTFQLNDNFIMGKKKWKHGGLNTGIHAAPPPHNKRTKKYDANGKLLVRRSKMEQKTTGDHLL